jgi:uncharacterized Zn finger protein
VVCKHTAAVHYILGERFDEEPFLLFRLRGRTEEQLTRALRARRGEEDREEVAGPDHKATPLEEEIYGFWEAKGVRDSVKVSVRPPTVRLSVLKRLGQPAFVGEDLERLLAPGYEAISRAALAMALGEEKDMETLEDASVPGTPGGADASEDGA